MKKVDTWRIKAEKDFPSEADESGCETIADYVERAKSTLDITEGGCSIYDDMTPRELRKFKTSLKNYIKRFEKHAEVVLTVEEMQEEKRINPVEDAPTADIIATAKELELTQRELWLQARLEALTARENELKVLEQQLEKKEQDLQVAHVFFKQKKQELKEKEQALNKREQELQEQEQEHNKQVLEVEEQVEALQELNETLNTAVPIKARQQGIDVRAYARAHQLYMENPNTPVEELAGIMKVSRRTFYRYLKKAEDIQSRHNRTK